MRLVLAFLTVIFLSCSSQKRSFVKKHNHVFYIYIDQEKKQAIYECAVKGCGEKRVRKKAKINQ